MKKLISAEDLYELKFVEDPQLSPDGQRLAFVRVDRLGNKYDRHIWLVDMNDRSARPRQFTCGGKNDWSPRWPHAGLRLGAQRQATAIFDGGQRRRSATAHLHAQRPGTTVMLNSRRSPIEKEHTT